MLGKHRDFHFLWVGRGKGKRLFLPFVLLSGSEGVKKPETERLPTWTGEACSNVEESSGRVVLLPPLGLTQQFI